MSKEVIKATIHVSFNGEIPNLDQFAELPTYFRTERDLPFCPNIGWDLFPEEGTSLRVVEVGLYLEIECPLLIKCKPKFEGVSAAIALIKKLQSDERWYVET